MKQLAALVGAVVMVLGALWIHGDFDGGGGGGGNGEETGRLLCAPELAQACEVISTDRGIEIVEQTAANDPATAAEAPQYDGWLTFRSTARTTEIQRSTAALPRIFDEPSEALARSPLVLVVWKDRAAALEDRCGGELTWKCLGDVAGLRWASIGGEEAWGDVKPGHADPATTAEGLAVIGQAAAQYFGTSDLSSLDYEDDGFLDWFTRLERAVVATTRGLGGGSPLGQMLAVGPAAFDVVATTEAEAGPLLAQVAPATRNAVTLLYPAPVASVDVVFVPVVDRGSAVGDVAPAALAEAGFRVDGESRAPGIPDRPELPGRSNLPGAGPLFALLDTWRGIVR